MNMRLARLLILAICCFVASALYLSPRALMAPRPVALQPGPSCTITGYIYKTDNTTPVAGATVRIVKATKAGANVLFSVSPTTTMTLEDGSFVITAPRGPNSTIWISAPTSGFNVSAGKPVAVPDAATAIFTMLPAVSSTPSSYLTVLAPTKTIFKQNGVAFATDIDTVNLVGFATLSESPSGQVNVSPASNPEISGTFETTLAVGYLLSGPSDDGIFRSSTGNLCLPNSNLGIKNSNPQAELDVTGTVRATKVNVTTFTPTGTADSSGGVGDIRWDADFIYVKTASGWRRSALASF